MAKTSSHITPLPADMVPTKSSNQLINEHVQRLLDRGERQKTIALSLGFKPNYVSQLKDGVDLLPLGRCQRLGGHRTCLGLEQCS